MPALKTKAPLDPDAYTLEEFCRRHMISVRHFYKLRQIGQGPAIIKVGKKLLISRESAARWREKMSGAA